jgi:hypothetical protein
MQVRLALLRTVLLGSCRPHLDDALIMALKLAFAGGFKDYRGLIKTVPQFA